MASEPDKRDRDLSAEDKLRAADRELAQLREVLASMDEIDALRKRDGKAASGEYGGYKRADAEAMIAELERRRRELLAEISSGGAQGGQDAAARERVTLSDALERLYAAISGSVERAKNEILREVRYSCRQDTAIYAELSARMDALADKVAERVLAAGIDTDELARRMVAHMTARSDAQTIEAMERRIEELEAALAARTQDAADEADALAEGETAAAEAPPAEEEAAEQEQLADEEVLPEEELSADEEVVEEEQPAEAEVVEEEQPAEAEVLPEEEQAADEEILPEEEQPADDEVVEEEQPAEAEVLPEEEQPAEAEVLPEEEQAADEEILPEEKQPADEEVLPEEEQLADEEVLLEEEQPADEVAEGARYDEKHTDEADPRDRVSAEGEASEQ